MTEAFVLVTNTWNRLFFLSFFCIAVLVGMNIVVAFMLDAFLEQFKRPKRDYMSFMSVHMDGVDDDRGGSEGGELELSRPHAASPGVSPRVKFQRADS